MDNQDSAKAAHGQQVITACAVIHEQIDGMPAVLLAKRAATKKFLPGKFELPGGHIDFGEQIETGLQRELAEELGIEVSVGDVFSAFTYVNEINGSHSVELLYFARLVEGSEPQTNPNDHSGIEWITEDKLPLLLEVNGADDAEYSHVVKALKLLAGDTFYVG